MAHIELMNGKYVNIHIPLNIVCHGYASILGDDSQASQPPYTKTTSLRRIPPYAIK